MKKRRLKHTLAVSTIVANMLMIAITLSLAAILVAWAGTSFGTFSSGSQLFFAQRGQAMQERFVVENVYFNKTVGNFIRVFVRNVGAEEVKIVALYMNGTNYSGSLVAPTPGSGLCDIPTGGYLLTVGAVCEFRVDGTKITWGVTGAVYNFVVATARGNQVTYSARGP